MAVYFIRAGENGPVKIGQAADPASRLFDFQSGHYEILLLVRQILGGRREERALHHTYRALRIRGEWFRWCETMATVIPDLAGAPDTHVSALRTFMDDHNLTEVQMAERLGISQSAVNRYASGLRMPRPHLLRRIEDVTSGKVGPSDFLIEYRGASVMQDAAA